MVAIVDSIRDGMNFIIDSGIEFGVGQLIVDLVDQTDIVGREQLIEYIIKEPMRMIVFGRFQQHIDLFLELLQLWFNSIWLLFRNFSKYLLRSDTVGHLFYNLYCSLDLLSVLYRIFA